MIIPDAELREDYIIPSVFNRDVAPAVAAAVAGEARASGQATVESEMGFAAPAAKLRREPTQNPRLYVG